MIKVEHLSFSYRKQEPILSDINFEFKEGKTYLILGKNGTGKTTLVRVILGFLKPTKGRVIKDQNKVISYLPDFNGIYDDLSILDNIKFRLALYSINFENKIELYHNLLTRYNLLEKENSKIQELSLGMKKKVAIIATLLVEADIYVLDEPTGGIDQESRKEIINILNEFNKDNKIVICITHEKELIENLYAEVLMLENGGLR